VMTLAIMQPYFCPYIGYFQLMSAVDTFIIYDNIQFTKKGWINRNRILANGKDEYFTLTLKKDSDYLNVNERFLSDDFSKDKIKLLNKIKASYQKAPYFNEVFCLLEEILNFKSNNLFDFIYNSLMIWRSYIGITNNFIKSSNLNIDIEQFKGEEKVIAICENLDAKVYINSIGGLELYKHDKFTAQNIDLRFIKSSFIEYKQFNNEFIPWLSIIDVAMFNDVVTIREYLTNYVLIK